MTSVIARIALRYLAGLLIAKGVIDAGFGREISTDAEVIGVIETIMGLTAAFVAEQWYRMARKFGWEK
jgi:hypothetical protein